MKRNTLLITVIMTVFCMCTAVKAQEQSYNQMCLLEVLGITENIDYNYKNTLTRSDFASLILKLLNFKGAAESGRGLYEDVTANVGDIEAVSDLGLMQGVGSGRFMPEKEITYEQAAVVLVRILGYEPVMQGSYPQNYLNQCAQLGIFDGISNISYNEPALETVIYAMIYNALDAEMLEAEYSGGRVGSYVKKGNTLLKEKFGVFKTEGVVTANGQSALSGRRTCGINEVKVDSEVYVNYDDETALSLGYNVVLFYSDKDGEKTALYSYKKDNETFSAKYCDIESFADWQYHIYTENGRKIYRMDQNTEIVYNKRGYSGSLNNINFVPEYGNVMGVDNNKDGTFDVLFIDEYKIYAAEKIKNNVIYIKYNDITSINLEEYEDFRIVDKQGELVSEDMVNEWDALFIAATPDKSYCEVIVSNEKASGRMDAFSDKNCTVSGTEYTISDSYFEINGNKIYVGSEGGYLLDLFDEIIYFYPSDFAYLKYAYMVKYISDISDKGEEENWIKLFTESGTMQTIIMAEKVKIDNTRYQTKQKVNTAMNDICKDTMRQVVRYRTNENNEIIELDTTTVTGDEQTEIASYYSNASVAYKLAASGFGGRVLIDASTRAFIVPSDGSESEEDFSVVTKSYFSNDKSYNIEGYRIGKENDTAKALVCYENVGTLKVNARSAIISDILLTVNEDNEPVYGIELMAAGKTQTLYTKNMDVMGDLSLQTGDVIRYKTDNAGKISILQLIYDESEDSFKLSTNFTNTAYNANIRVAKASVYARTGRILTLTTNELSENYPDDAFMCFGNVFSVYVYNREEKSLKEGTYNDIMAYLSTPDLYSTVIVHTEWGDPKSLFVYNKE